MGEKGEILGWRQWTIINNDSGLTLRSLTQDFLWDKNVLYAGGKPYPDFAASGTIGITWTIEDFKIRGSLVPGLFSWKSVPVNNEWFANPVSGIIKPFGTTVIHEKGIRSEYAQMIDLCSETYCQSSHPDKRMADIMAVYPIFVDVWCNDCYEQYFPDGHSHKLAKFISYEDGIKYLANKLECNVLTMKEIKEKLNGNR